MSTKPGAGPLLISDGAEDIKSVPQDAATRAAIRRRACDLAGSPGPNGPPVFDALQSVGRQILQGLSLPDRFLGFAMVAADNAAWAGAFRAVPFQRRLLLLPKCLSDRAHCEGWYDSVGLHCAGCGRCVISGLKQQAEELGYDVVVAEGTSSVLMKVVEGEADAIVGVACLDSLQQSFQSIAELGIPHQAIPLLNDGCKDTTAEVELVAEMIAAQADEGPTVQRSYLPLLRETGSIFDMEALTDALASCVCAPSGDGADQGQLAATDAIARDWLQRGGKRLRPFITLSAYAVGKHGMAALSPDAELPALIPPAIRRIAVAIEALHKASLVHDDIEDDDPYRYGQPTLHRTHGIGQAINIGDYLVGLGYRLICAQASELGAECIADILGHLSAAHLQLCCGQGAELMWSRRRGGELRPLHALQIGRLKTAPAFEVALYAGLRAAEAGIDDSVVRSFSTYIGEGYQIRNDLSDWDADGGNKVSLGQDVLASRPTVLRAFALEAGAGNTLAALLDASPNGDEESGVVDQARRLYTDTGAFEKAELLYVRLRERSLALADTVSDPPLQDLLRLLARIVLPERNPTLGAERP